MRVASCSGVARAAAALLAVALAGEARGEGGVVDLDQAAAVAGGVTPTDLPGFPITLDRPGSYRLSSDLVVTQNESAISIPASGSGAQIDLAGFAIRGPTVCTGAGTALACVNTGAGIGVSGLAASDVAIRNGRILGTGSKPIELGARALLEDLIAASCGNGVTCEASCGVFRLTVDAVQRNAIDVGSHSRVIDSVARNSEWDGISATATGLVASGNAISRNGLRGIDAGVAASVVENAVFENGGDGIAAGFGASVARNAVRLNGGVGLVLDTNAGYARNTMSNNGGAEVSGGSDLGGNSCDAGACP
jgi:hypothetical protein